VESWFVLIGLSVLTGGVSALVLRGRAALLTAAILPPAVFLSWLLVHEFVLPYSGGGASMWPVAFIFGGGAAAGSSVFTLSLVNLSLKNRRHES
jgi:hypothetical protein